jgi:DNA-binding transcriptional ArsR family regulator
MAAAVQVIQSAAAAESLLNADRMRILEALAEPASAAGVARVLQLPRQKVNYHLHELEKHGLAEFVEERKKGNCVERVMRATARSYVVSPAALGSLGLNPPEARDRFSCAYLVHAAARAIRDLATLRSRADKAGQRLATLTLETEIRFASAEQRKAFSDELLKAVAALTAKYHDENASGGRRFRLMLGAYPAITKDEPEGESSIRME